MSSKIEKETNYSQEPSSGQSSSYSPTPEESSEDPLDQLTTRSVFVGGVKASFTQEEIESYFSEFGEIESIKMKKNKRKDSNNRGFCIVKFVHVKSAKRAISLKNHVICNRKVTCREFLTGELLRKSKAIKNCRKLYISNLPESTVNEDVEKLFRRFGELEFAYTLSDKITGLSKGFGFVTYAETGARERALALNGQLEIRGTVIEVDKFTSVADRKKAGMDDFGDVEGVSEGKGTENEVSGTPGDKKEGSDSRGKESKSCGDTQTGGGSGGSDDAKKGVSTPSRSAREGDGPESRAKLTDDITKTGQSLNLLDELSEISHIRNPHKQQTNLTPGPATRQKPRNPTNLQRKKPRYHEDKKAFTSPERHRGQNWGSTRGPRDPRNRPADYRTEPHREDYFEEYEPEEFYVENPRSSRRPIVHRRIEEIYQHDFEDSQQDWVWDKSEEGHPRHLPDYKAYIRRRKRRRQVRPNFSKQKIRNFEGFEEDYEPYPESIHGRKSGYDRPVLHPGREYYGKYEDPYFDPEKWECDEYYDYDEGAGFEDDYQYELNRRYTRELQRPQRPRLAQRRPKNGRRVKRAAYPPRTRMVPREAMDERRWYYYGDEYSYEELDYPENEIWSERDLERMERRRMRRERELRPKRYRMQKRRPKMFQNSFNRQYEVERFEEEFSYSERSFSDYEGYDEYLTHLEDKIEAESSKKSGKEGDQTSSQKLFDRLKEAVPGRSKAEKEQDEAQNQQKKIAEKFLNKKKGSQILTNFLKFGLNHNLRPYLTVYYEEQESIPVFRLALNSFEENYRMNLY